MWKRIFSCIVLSTCILGNHIQAQSGPIRLIVPFPPGDALDSAARTLADNMGKKLKRSIVVENKPGASGFIAATTVARSHGSDTLLLGTTAMMSITPFIKKAPYSPSDFTPVSRIAEITPVFTVSEKSAAKSWQEFVALAKKKPGAYSYASPGEGTILHISIKLLESAAGIELLHVPYKGMGPALQDFLGGRVDVYAEPAVIEHIKAGTARALAVMGKKRLSDLPDVPTLAEQGVAFDVQPWIGLFANANVDPKFISEIQSAIEDSTSSDQFKKGLPPGVEEAFANRQEFSHQIASEQILFKSVISKLNLKLD